MNLCIGIRRTIAMVGEAAKSHSNFAQVRLFLAQIIVVALLPMVPVHFSLQNGSARPLDERVERISGARYFRADHNNTRRVTVPKEREPTRGSPFLCVLKQH